MVNRTIFSSEQELWGHAQSEDARNSLGVTEARVRLQAEIIQPKAGVSPPTFTNANLHTCYELVHQPNYSLISSLDTTEPYPVMTTPYSSGQSPFSKNIKSRDSPQSETMAEFFWPVPADNFSHDINQGPSHADAFSTFNSGFAVDFNNLDGLQCSLSVPDGNIVDVSPVPSSEPARLHASNAGHLTASLDFQPDPDLMNIFDEISNSIPFHAEKQQETPNTCQQCNKHFQTRTRLDSHARQTNHKPYACMCGGTFARFDILSRHTDKYFPREFYPCPYCSRFSGLNAFHRADHLTQHLRSGHNIDVTEQRGKSKKKIPSCPQEGCPYHSASFGQGGKMTFRNPGHFTRHMREVHDTCLFPCTVPGCPKTRGKGFFKEGNLTRHLQRDHGHRVLAPGASLSSPSPLVA